MKYLLHVPNLSTIKTIEWNPIFFCKLDLLLHPCRDLWSAYHQAGTVLQHFQIKLKCSVPRSRVGIIQLIRQ